MARARNLKPGFFTNDRLAECEPLARLLFAGLWTIADREGRLEDRPKKIKAELLPYDNSDCDALLKQLHDTGFIKRYRNNDNAYIQILNFQKHQNPHVKEAASTIPAPDKPDTNTILVGPLTSSLLPLTDSPLQGEREISTSEIILPRAVIKNSKPGRGTRLSPDWDLPKDWGEWAEKQGMSPTEIVRECDKFKDYWISTSGSKATKTDWEATWRNWIRRRLEEYAK